MKFRTYLLLTIILCCIFVVNTAAQDLSAPTLSVEVSGTKVSIAWDAVEGAEGYTLFYSPYPDADYISNLDLGNITNISFSIDNNIGFFVAVKAYNSNGNSNFSNIEYFIITPESDDENSEDEDDSEIVRPDGWTEETHGKIDDPDYSTVFAQDVVKRMDITIDPENWQAMLDDMTDLVGEFGSSGHNSGMERPTENTEIANDSDSSQTEDSTESSETNEISEDSTTSETDDIEIPDMAGNPPDDISGERPEGMGERPDMGEDMGAGGGVDMLSRNPIYVPCTISFEDKTWTYVGIRFKGNSSLVQSWQSGNYKISLKLNSDEFEDDYPEIENQRFFGFKKLSLTSNFEDESLLREKIVADIFRDAGVPAPMTSFYRLYVDYGEGPIFFGIYTLIEIPDNPMLNAQFGDDEGNLYKPEGTGAKWVTFDQDSFDKETNKSEEDWSDIEAAFSALHASRDDASTWRTGLETIFNVEGFLRWLAVNTVIQNWDTYGNMAHNYYMYANPSDNGKLTWIPWDNNLALNSNYGGMNSGIEMPEGMETPEGMEIPEGIEIPEGTEMPEGMEMPDDMGMGGNNNSCLSLGMTEVGDDWPLIRYLIDDHVYYEMYIGFIKETIEGVFKAESAKTRMQTAYDLIAPYVVDENNELLEIEGYTHIESATAFEQALETLFNHVDERQTAVSEFLNGIE